MNFILNNKLKIFYLKIRDIFSFLILISVVHSWTTLEVYYKICEQDKTSVIHYDKVHKGIYGGYVGEYNVDHAEYDDGNNLFRVTLKGCTPECKLGFAFNPFNPNSHVPNILDFPTYSCDKPSTYPEFKVDMTSRITFDDPKRTNKIDPAAPQVTYQYCKNGKYISDGSEMPPQTSISSCIDKIVELNKQKRDPFSYVINLDGETWHDYSDNNLDENVSRLLTVSKNYLSYFRLQNAAINDAFIDLSGILPDIVKDLTPPAAPPPSGSHTFLSTFLKVMSAAIGAIDNKLYESALGAFTTSTGFKIQSIIGGAISTVSSSLAGSGDNIEIPIPDLGRKEAEFHEQALKALQNVVDNEFLNGDLEDRDITLLNSFVHLNTDKVNTPQLSSQILKKYQSGIASLILNHYDVVVCKEDNIDSEVCFNLCCEESIGGCNRRNFCNTRTIDGVEGQCLFMGGWANGAGGIYNIYSDYLKKMSMYGDLKDACATRYDENRGGWNLKLANCADDNYRTCCYCDPNDDLVCNINVHWRGGVLCPQSCFYCHGTTNPDSRYCRNTGRCQ